MNKYYYLKGDAQQGPLVVDELKTQITRETLVWCEGMSDWLAAKDVPEIAGVLPPPVPGVNTSTPPPPPPPNPTKPQPQLRSISYDQEKKSSKKWWFIIGGSFVGLMLFFLYNFSPFTPAEITSEPNIETPVVDDSVESDEEVTTNFIETNNVSNEKEVAREKEAIKEKEAAKIAEEKERVLKVLICANFQQYFTAKIVNADIHDFGGMSDVFVEVSNSTNYHAEKISLYLEYLKENGNLWKSERMEIYDLGPWKSTTVQAPGSHRGNRVRVTVEVVESKELGLYEGSEYN